MKKLTYSQRLKKDSEGIDLTSATATAELLKAMNDTPPESITTVSPQGHDKDSIVSGQDQDNTLSVSGHQKVTSGIPKDHHPVMTVSTPDHDTVMTGSISKSQKVSPLDHDTVMIPTTNKSTPIGSPSIGLTKKQSNVYNWFLNRGINSYYNKQEISRALSITPPTVRKIINKFKNLGILIHIDYDKYRKRYIYTLNTEIPVDFENITTVSPQGHDTVTTGSPTSNSSSSILKKTNLLEKIKMTLKSNPEFQIWVERKLPPEKIIDWMEKTNVPLENVLESMCHKIHQLKKNNFLDENDKPIKNLENYFWGSFSKAHGYIGPDSDYKSWEELQLEQVEKQNRKRRELAERKEKARLEEIELKMRVEFNGMMDQPESENFKLCFERIDTFVKNRRNKSKKAWKTFEDRMFSEYEKLMSE